METEQISELSELFAPVMVRYMIVRAVSECSQPVPRDEIRRSFLSLALHEDLTYERRHMFDLACRDLDAFLDRLEDDGYIDWVDRHSGEQGYRVTDLGFGLLAAYHRAAMDSWLDGTDLRHALLALFGVDE